MSLDTLPRNRSARVLMLAFTITVEVIARVLLGHSDDLLAGSFVEIVYPQSATDKERPPPEPSAGEVQRKVG